MKENPTKRKNPIPPPPRPRKKIGDELPHVATSMKAGALAWGLPVSEIRRARTGGCKAFVGQKVYLDGLTAWLTANPPAPASGGGESLDDADKEELERRKLIRVVNRLDIGIQSDRHKLAVTKDEFVPKELVKEEWTRRWAIIEAEAKDLMDKSIFPVFVARVKAKIK